MNKTPELDPVLASYARIAETIATQFGSNCQASLYDMRQTPPTAVAAAGSVMHLDVGSPLSAQVMRRISGAKTGETDRTYFTSTTPDGLRLSSSATMLRDARGRLIGCMCIDLCIENLIASIDVLQNFCNLRPELPEKEDASEDIAAVVDAIISEALRERRISAGSDTKSERLKIVSQLERKGVFLVKGAVELISGRLNISKFTLYSYLDEIRSGDDAAEPDLDRDGSDQSEARRGR